MHTADFSSHHIEGYAHAAYKRGLPSYFDVPLISHIEGGLWMGGCRAHTPLPSHFDLVVSLYKWERYLLPEGAVLREVEMFDSADVPDPSLIMSLAREVVDALESGQDVLVHCQAGLNRSGLISATALTLMGRSPEESIALLREKRCDLVLCNESFENWLLGRTGLYTDR